jgi:hypothetical protein
MSTRATNTAAAIALAGAAAGCVWLLADTRAPVSGVLLVAWAAAVVAVGAMTTLARALLLAVGVIVVPVVVAWAAVGSGDAAGVSESCDPGCISLGGALGLAVIAAAVLALVGLAVGAVGRRLWPR